MYSISTRTCAVTIFKSLLGAINQNIPNKEEKEKLLNPVLPVFINKLIVALGTPTGQHTSFAMKCEIIKGTQRWNHIILTHFLQIEHNQILQHFFLSFFYISIRSTVLTLMVNDMSKFIYQYNAQILPPVWQLLTQTAEIYAKAVVNEIDSTVNDQEDDELNDFITLILQLFEFILAIVDQKRFHSILKPVLTDLMYISIIYMQITEEQATAWMDDSELYVDDMTAEVFDTSIRISSKDVLVNIGTEFGTDFLLPLSDALTRHVQVAEAEKNVNNPHWWKIIEASVTAVGFLKKYIVDVPDDDERKNFNLRDYLSYTKTMLGQGSNGSGYQGDVSPFLHGRCLWVLSKFADVSTDIYDRQNLQAILECIKNNFSHTKPMVIQISAIRALFEMCTDLKTASDEQRMMIVEKLPSFLNFIPDIATRAKVNILIEVLSTISAVAAVCFFICVLRKSEFNVSFFLQNSSSPFFLFDSLTKISRPIITR